MHARERWALCPLPSPYRTVIYLPKAYRQVDWPDSSNVGHRGAQLATTSDTLEDGRAGKPHAPVVGVRANRLDIRDFVYGFVPHAAIRHEVAVGGNDDSIQVL